MRLFAMLIGEDSNAQDLLKLLGINQGDIPRYRSCYWDGTYIIVHTRTGGGNREFYESLESCLENYPEYFEDQTRSPDGPWNEDLRKIPGYVKDEDSDFDCTYADFYYTPPKGVEEALAALPISVPPAERWQAVFKALEALPQT